MDEYELERMEPAAKRLVERDPKRAYDFFKAKLLASLDDSLRKGTLFWRAAIEDHAQNFTHTEERLHFMVKWTRDTLLALVDQQADEGLDEVTSLLASDEPILKRLGLHVMMSQPDLIMQLEVPIVTEASLFDHELFHEMMLLLHKHFQLLPQDQKELVHQAILDGPPPRGEESEDDRRSRIASWRRHLVGILAPENLTDDEKAWREEFGLGPEPTDQQFFQTYMTSGWVAESEEAPDLRVARQEGFDKLLDVLRQNTRAWNGVRQLVQEGPDGMLDFAAKLEAQDFYYIWPYLDAYSELMKGGVAFRWAPLIELCERIVSERPGAEGSHIAEVSRFLRNGLGSKPEKLGIPDDLLDRAFQVIVQLLDGRYTRLEVGLEDSRDTSVHQLNSAPGEAADAFMFYVWRRGTESKEGDGIPAQASDRIGNALSEGWGGMELRHAIGQFLNVLEWLEPGWVEANLPALFPQGDTLDAFNARKAMVNGYLLCRPTSRSLMRSLTRMFAEVIPDTGREERLYLDERIAVNPFTDQIVIGWIWNLEGFGIDGLLGELVAEANDEVRARIVWFLGAEYANADEEWRRTLWDKMDEYWSWRVESLRSLAIDEPSEELTRFCAWVRDLAIPLDQIESRLQFSIQHFSMYFGVHVLLENLVTRAASETAAASRLLEFTVDTLADTPEMHWSSADLKKALDALCEYAGAQERKAIGTTADRLLAVGILDYREELKNCGKK